MKRKLKTVWGKVRQSKNKWLSAVLSMCMTMSILIVHATPAMAAASGLSLGQPKWVTENSTYQLSNLTIGNELSNIKTAVVSVDRGGISSVPNTAGTICWDLNKTTATIVFSESLPASSVQSILRAIVFNYVSGQTVTIILIIILRIFLRMQP